jgi:hypothetical protein
MAAAGPVVPTLNWYREVDLDRQLAWLTSRQRWAPCKVEQSTAIAVAPTLAMAMDIQRHVEDQDRSDPSNWIDNHGATALALSMSVDDAEDSF